MNNKAIITKARAEFHRQLVQRGVLSIDGNNIPSNADKDNKPSCAIALRVAQQLRVGAGNKLTAQTAGKVFEELVCWFLNETFPKLQHLRPGSWEICNLGNKNAVKAASFSQYEHLAILARAIKENQELATIIGNDYMVAPDIVVSRNLCNDEEINAPRAFVDDTVSLKADLRKANGGTPIMHASVSAKWTMRSDRAQNSRTEALNLIRNRKGHLPHIVVVTGEPLPSRLASLALGTGDLDCVYHFALYELVQAVREYGKDDRQDLIDQLEMLIEGKRLKDISDLPLDLAC